jgi:hypothetical protein
MISFKCPRCGTEDRLTLVQHPVDFIQESDLLVMILDGMTFPYLGPEVPRTQGICEQYHCDECGYILPGITSAESLLEYLKNPAFKSED